MIALLSLALVLPALVPHAAAIPREDVLDNAARYHSHEWTADADNLTATCSSDWESDYTLGTYTGLPYDWGGYYTLDEFDDALADGLGAGSHSWHGVLSCTAGVDCSGFISELWETRHYSTSTFASGDTHEITWASIKRGDAVNDAGSHAVLYTHETDGGWPVFYEASGSAEKVRLNATGGWSYVSGYQPIRFDDIEDGVASGTRGAPRDITSFPFSDFRWTAGAASDVIDSYSCAPDADESGPEVLYRFEAATQGTLEVLVSDDVGVDVDVHVLSGPSGEACLDRDDTTVSLQVGPGTVWIAVDTWVGSQEFPGAYVMSATFDGRLGELEDPEPVDDTGSVDTPDDTAGPDDTDEPAGFGGERDTPSATRKAAPEDPKGCATVPGSASVLLGAIAAIGSLIGRRRR